ncbi:DUF5518 domain-containing protein [Halorientalis pallida]|uniref:DUF5518 domain-containing protein n=1 Tax=Halorientalis pallida TaxID=2479928 RepID=UPI003C6EF322
MARPALPDPRTDAAWRYALVAGLVSGATVLLAGWRATELDARLGPVALAAVFGGVLFANTTIAGKTVGLRTGAVAAVPLLLPVGAVARSIPTFAQPAWFGVVQTLLLVGVAAVVIAFTALAGAVGGALGEWLAGKLGRERRSSPPAGG